MAWTTKSPIRGNHWVPLSCRALLGSVNMFLNYEEVAKIFILIGLFIKIKQREFWTTTADTYVCLWWFMSVKSSVLWLNPKCEFWTKDEIDYLAPSCSQHEIHCTVHTVKCLLIWSWRFSAKGNLYPIKTVTFSTFKATRPQYACMIFIIIFSTLVHGMEFLAKYSWKSWLSWLLKVCI